MENQNNLNLIEFLSHFDELNPRFKANMLNAIKWGMWIGGITAILISAILHAIL